MKNMIENGDSMIQKWILCFILFILWIQPTLSEAKNFHPMNDQRKQLFETMETLTQLPWYYFAALNQYEENLRHLETKKDSQKPRISIQIPPKLWAGPLNPNPNDTHLLTIQLFHGIGQDGNGDRKADRQNELDRLYALGNYLVQKGTSSQAIREQLWQYYQHPTTVDIITHIAQIFKKYNHTQLNEKHFPLPTESHYTYRSTWGDRRGWGGLRIHEGSDLFADYGTPVLSTCYGYIELIGWNRYGGWRIGIRDVNNHYHYFAHLQGYRKGLKKGDIVRPGEVIGSVGSSGYGPPGTSGKFPPHLHYGIYRFNGKNTYAFDPYPKLKQWERESKKKTSSRSH